jgi:transmembrane sensor
MNTDHKVTASAANPSGNQGIEESANQQEIGELIALHFKGETTQEQEKLISDWMSRSENNRQALFDLAAIVNAEKEVSDEDCDSLLERIHGQIAEDEKTMVPYSDRGEKKSHHLTLFGYIAIAAAVAIAVCIPIYKDIASKVRMDNELSAAAVYYNNGNDVLHFNLPDGSTVLLQPNSGLKYFFDTQSNQRIAQLDGEAYFDIARDSLKPFIVKSRYIHLRVLGTAFYVKAFDNAQNVEVGLERGAVNVLSADNRNLMHLHPNQKIVYDVETGFLDTSVIDATDIISQRYSISILENVSVRGIVAHIEQAYHVRVSVSGVKPNERYNISYRSRSSLEELMKIVEGVTGGRCRIEKQAGTSLK